MKKEKHQNREGRVHIQTQTSDALHKRKFLLIRCVFFSVSTMPLQIERHRVKGKRYLSHMQKRKQAQIPKFEPIP